MADIAPLRPLRYAAADLSNLVAPPYDVISPTERLELMARSPHNVVRLILPDGEGDAKYGQAAALLGAWRKEGALVRDEQAAFYRYDQSFDPPGGGARRTRRGFLALVRVVPFEDRVVLPHERTLSGPKEDRLKLFRATRTNLSPGFMLYRDPEARARRPARHRASIVSTSRTADGVEHALAKVTAPEAIRAIVDHIGKSSLLIADGHHRYETALRYSQEIDWAQAARQSLTFRDPSTDTSWSFLCNGDDPNLVVFATHRLVHSLPTLRLGRFPSQGGRTLRSHAADGDLTAAEARFRPRSVDDPMPRLAVASGRAGADGAKRSMALLTLRAGSTSSSIPRSASGPRWCGPPTWRCCTAGFSSMCSASRSRPR